MSDTLLARQYVEFFAKGLDDVQKATEQYKQKLEAANKSADLLSKSLSSGAYRQAAEQTHALNQRVAQLAESARRVDLEVKLGKTGAAMQLAHERLGRMKEGLEKISGPAAVGFGVLVGGVMGFVRAGLAGTVQGDRLSMAVTMLSQQIASVFLPVVEAVTVKIQALAQWMRHLTGAKQEAIMKWVGVAAAVLGVVMVLPKVVGGIQAVIGIVKLMSTVIAAVGAEAGIASGGILPLIGIIVTAAVALGAFMAKTKAGGAALDKLQETAGRLVATIMPTLNRLMTTGTQILERLGESVLPVVVAQFEMMASTIEVVFLAVEKLNGALENLEKKSKFLGAIGRGLAGPLFWGGGGPGGKDQAGNRHQVTPNDKGFESAIDTWRRFATAGSKTPAQEQVSEQKETNKKLDQSNNMLMSILLPIGSIANAITKMVF